MLPAGFAMCVGQVLKSFYDYEHLNTFISSQWSEGGSLSLQEQQQTTELMLLPTNGKNCKDP